MLYQFFERRAPQVPVGHGELPASSYTLPVARALPTPSPMINLIKEVEDIEVDTWIGGWLWPHGLILYGLSTGEMILKHRLM